MEPFPELWTWDADRQEWLRVPTPSSESLSAEPSASPSIDPVPTSGAADDSGPMLLLLFVLAVLAAGAVIGVIAWRYVKARRERRPPTTPSTRTT